MQPGPKLSYRMGVSYAFVKPSASPLPSLHVLQLHSWEIFEHTKCSLWKNTEGAEPFSTRSQDAEVVLPHKGIDLAAGKMPWALCPVMR